MYDYPVADHGVPASNTDLVEAAEKVMTPPGQEEKLSTSVVSDPRLLTDGSPEVKKVSEKKIVPESAGTFPVTTPLFVVLLVSVILIVSALTFFPVLSLGPIVEHFLMQAGRLF